MTQLMRRWTMSAIGRKNLQLTTTTVPHPGMGEILVKVSAVSLNYRDKLVIESGMGLPLTFPFSPASDMAGVVLSVGASVTRFGPGDRVISTFAPGWIDGLNAGTARHPPYKTLGGIYPGVLSEYVCLSEDWLSAAPVSLDDDEASTLPCAALTAWFAFVEQSNLQAGKTVVVHGTGGVALFGLQIAKAQGTTVIVVSGCDDKIERAIALGATYGINRKSDDWVEAVYRLTDDRGADHILETVGGAHLGQSIKAAAVGGRISVIGVLEGFEVSSPVAPLMLKGVTIQGIGVGHRRSLENLTRAIDELKIKPVIDARYEFSDLPSALKHLDRGPFGKIVVTTK
ncbi:MAG: NAD(P)-dependent alcohol dehydrogenase [Rhodocyclaceae bacterium]|nr:NAD(P)-dependent alcohol dehydrogenase [Rhodocyclaceae bacterium]